MPYGPYNSPYSGQGLQNQNGNRPSPQIQPWKSPYGVMPPMPQQVPQTQSPQQLSASRPGDIRPPSMQLPAQILERAGDTREFRQPMPNNLSSPPPPMLPEMLGQDPMAQMQAPPALAGAPGQTYGAVPFVENMALSPMERESLDPTKKQPGFPFTVPYRVGGQIPNGSSGLRLPGLRTD